METPIAPPVCAIYTTFHPDDGLPARVEKVRQQVRQIVIVDNTAGGSQSPSLAAIRGVDRIEIIDCERNLGVGEALNVGANRARERGFEWGLTLDQDSEIANDMVHQLWAAVEADSAPASLAIVAPQVIEASLGRHALFLRPRWGILYRRSPCNRGTPMAVTTAITSGSVVNLSIHAALGGFREDFFMDYIDTEYCLRAGLSGNRIVAVCGRGCSTAWGIAARSGWVRYRSTPRTTDARDGTP